MEREKILHTLVSLDEEQLKHLAICMKLVSEGYKVFKITDDNDKFFVLTKPTGGQNG